MAPRKKSNPSRRIFIIAVLMGLLLLIGYQAYDWWNRNHPRFVRYREFGIEIPVNYSVHGIDVSRYQGTIDWKEVKAMNVRNIRLSFAFIKATEGINSTDPYFKRNWKLAKENTLPRGAYHYFIANRSGAEQAANFMAMVSLQKGDLPPVLDIEEDFNVSKATLQKEAKAFLDALEAYYGIRPIIYSNADFYEKNLAGVFDNYPLWVAHYLQRNKPRIGRNWIFWQHNDGGRVNGIMEKTDFNVFNGTPDAFQDFLLR
jgi:lysozyme